MPHHTGAPSPPHTPEGLWGQCRELLVLPGHKPPSLSLQEAQSSSEWLQADRLCTEFPQTSSLLFKAENTGCYRWVEKCELPHCLQSSSDWRMLFWKSEGLQTGLGKQIVSALAFYFCSPWLQLHLPTPHTQTPPQPGFRTFPHTYSFPQSFCIWLLGGLFQTPFVSSISLKHWKATSKKPGSSSPLPVLAAVCPVLCQALPLQRSPQAATATSAPAQLQTDRSVAQQLTQ